VAPRTKLWVCGHLLAGFVGSNPAGAWMFLCFKCWVLSSRGFCVGPITSLEESYRVCIWVWSWSPISGGCDSESGQSTRGKKIVYGWVLILGEGKLYTALPIYSYFLYVIFLFGFPIKILYPLVNFQLDAQNSYLFTSKIHLLKSSTCFEHYPAHLREVYVVIVYM